MAPVLGVVYFEVFQVAADVLALIFAAATTADPNHDIAEAAPAEAFAVLVVGFFVAYVSAKAAGAAAEAARYLVVVATAAPIVVAAEVAFGEVAAAVLAVAAAVFVSAKDTSAAAHVSAKAAGAAVVATRCPAVVATAALIVVADEVAFDEGNTDLATDYAFAKACLVAAAASVKAAQAAAEAVRYLAVVATAALILVVAHLAGFEVPAVPIPATLLDPPFAGRTKNFPEGPLPPAVGCHI